MACLATIVVAEFFLPVEMFHYINITDNTYITYIVLALFLATTASLGYQLHFSKTPIDFNRYWFIEQELLALGFLGTIIGLMETFAVFYFGASTSDLNNHIAQGMGAALTTTAAGIICAMHLRWQLWLVEDAQAEE